MGMHKTQPRQNATGELDEHAEPDLERGGEDAGDEVVVVGFGDFGAVEAAGLSDSSGAEVVDIDLAVDFGGVELRAAFPEER